MLWLCKWQGSFHPEFLAAKKSLVPNTIPCLEWQQCQGPQLPRKPGGRAGLEELEATQSQGAAQPRWDTSTKDMLHQCPELILASLTRVWIAGPGSRDPNHGIHNSLGTIGSCRALFQEIFSPSPTKTYLLFVLGIKTTTPSGRLEMLFICSTLGSLHSHPRQH